MSVQHLPLFHAEIFPGLVTTPTHSSLFPLLPSSIVDIQARLLSEVIVGERGKQDTVRNNSIENRGCLFIYTVGMYIHMSFEL